jgi:hypothetical protein
MSPTRSELKLATPGFAEGPRSALVPELRRLQASGEIKVNWRGTVRVPDLGPDHIAVPYVRLRSPDGGVAPNSVVWRAVGWMAVGCSAIAGVGWLLWESRWVLVSLAGAALLVMSVAWLWSLRGGGCGCVGLHCPGCRG